MVTFLSPIFPNNNSLSGTLLCSRLNKLTTILSGISSSSFFSYNLIYCFYFIYINACLNVYIVPCMCLVSTEARKGSQVPWLWGPGGLSHLSSSRGSFFQEADFPFLTSELALRVALTDRLWERWHDSSTREPVKVEFYLENPSPPPCGKAPNERLQRQKLGYLCSQNEPSPLTDLPSECSHGSRQNQQKNLSRGPTKEWKVL